jgi:hypothetical protein
VKTAISAVNSAYDNLAKASKQFAEMSHANVEAMAAGQTQKKKAA